MKIRKTSRKTITLPGRYITGLGKPEDVLLTDLSVGGCRITYGDRKVILGAPIQIFIGNTGPHRATIKWIKGEELGVTFTQPLSEEQFTTFQNSHVPDRVTNTVSGEFDEMNGTAPQRFC